MASKNWQYLKPGDIVDIVAPASATKRGVVAQGVKALQRMGLRPRVNSKIINKAHPLFANLDEFRFNDLKRALLAKDSKAIWCLRGGYGAIRLLPHLEKLKRPKHNKVVMGYSDITSLHIFLDQKWHWPTVHGPLIDRLANGSLNALEKKDIESLLFGSHEEIVFKGLKPMNVSARKKSRAKGIIKGTMAGGNLTVCISTLGTQWQLKGRGKILFFEDLQERGYRVDRMLVQMEQAGVFDGVKAVIFGNFSGGEEPGTKKKLWKRALQEFADRSKFPVFSGLKSGHCIPNRPVPIGTTAILKRGASKGSLELRIAHGGRV